MQNKKENKCNLIKNKKSKNHNCYGDRKRNYDNDIVNINVINKNKKEDELHCQTCQIYKTCHSLEILQNIK